MVTLTRGGMDTDNRTPIKGGVLSCPFVHPVRRRTMSVFVRLCPAVRLKALNKREKQ